MFIFLSLPSGNEQPHSDFERNTLQTFQSLLTDSHSILAKSEYESGYGNITGYQLSYEDHLQGKKIKDWPIHKYNKNQPWEETQEYSILPNAVSDKVKRFWGKELVHQGGNAYLLNISGRADGQFELIENEVKPVKYEIPTFLQTYYNARTSNDDTDFDNISGGGGDGRKASDDDIVGKAPKIGNITKDGLISLVVQSYQYNFNEPDFQVVNESDRVSNAVVASLELNLKDYLEVEDHMINMKGVYFQDTGSLVATSNSAKFLGSYGLSHLAMNNESFEIAKKLMSQFNEAKNNKDVTLDDMNTAILRSIDQCEIVSYFQFNRTSFSYDELRYIDSELREPTGRPLPHAIPQLAIKEFLIYSPDCGLLLTRKTDTSFTGVRSEVLQSQMKSVLTGILVLVCIQLYLIFKQSSEARTPGQLSVISSKTLFLFAFEDALLAVMSLLLSTLTADLYLLLACIATVAFMSCGIFEMRFMVNVLTIQANERGTTWWQIMRGSSYVPLDSSNTESTPATEHDEGPILPIANTPVAPAPPTPTPQQTEPVPNQAWQETSYSNSIFATGFTLTIVAMFLIFSSLGWRLRYRIIFEYVCLIFINSYWIPQFLRNTLKNRRKAFSWEFVFGSSIIRVIPIYYFALFRANPLRHRYDPVLCTVVTFWVAFQLMLLVLQNALGARFWINEKWLPKAYDYQQVLSLRNLEEDGFSSDLLASFKHKTTTTTTTTTSTSRNDKNTGESSAHVYVECECTCPICMTDVTLPIIVKEDIEGNSRKKLHALNGVKKDYMITPCHHIFHVGCLENWMKYKLQCPVCRTSLPPI
ncbi:hypothetical protein KGF56_000074 [Candida oxycetoniae]|uniref:RING-type E3 ubiquitin transferase n=1 Tax=Candida oxycetoniae TaxID=497107 RepID=A0AAI9X063_9ASCO|nr:uncharacterized protein KGF56_000074 [Candida oxycetoniae]KAI3407087.2 hypothetical protein KGF56_000074 [Candida oxycetoniae]